MSMEKKVFAAFNSYFALLNESRGGRALIGAGIYKSTPWNRVVPSDPDFAREALSRKSGTSPATKRWIREALKRHDELARVRVEWQRERRLVEGRRSTADGQLVKLPADALDLIAYHTTSLADVLSFACVHRDVARSPRSRWRRLVAEKAFAKPSVAQDVFRAKIVLRVHSMTIPVTADDILALSSKTRQFACMELMCVGTVSALRALVDAKREWLKVTAADEFGLPSAQSIGATAASLNGAVASARNCLRELHDFVAHEDLKVLLPVIALKKTEHVRCWLYSLRQLINSSRRPA